MSGAAGVLCEKTGRRRTDAKANRSGPLSLVFEFKRDGFPSENGVRHNRTELVRGDRQKWSRIAIHEQPRFRRIDGSTPFENDATTG